MKLAVTGKGGVGKTTLAGTLARLSADEGRSVLAIDADPDANLASALGFPRELVEKIHPIVEMEELIAERTGAQKGTIGGYFKLNPKVDDLPDTLSAQFNGVRLLIMGTVKKGGAGCICPESVLLKQLLRHLLVKRTEVVILDMEAGIEHLGRGTAESVDALIVVVEPGTRSLQTAQTISRLASDLGISRTLVVGNKIHGQGDRDFITKNLPELEVLGFIDYDPGVIEADVKGISAYDTDKQLVESTRIILKKLEEDLGRREVSN